MPLSAIISLLFIATPQTNAFTISKPHEVPLLEETQMANTTVRPVETTHYDNSPSDMKKLMPIWKIGIAGVISTLLVVLHEKLCKRSNEAYPNSDDLQAAENYELQPIDPSNSLEVTPLEPNSPMQPDAVVQISILSSEVTPLEHNSIMEFETSHQTVFDQVKPRSKVIAYLSTVASFVSSKVNIILQWPKGYNSLRHADFEPPAGFRVPNEHSIV